MNSLTVLALSTILDYILTGRLYLPLISFVTQNLLLGVSTFYGRSPWHYHLTQSLPILLTTAIPFVVRGLTSIILSKEGGSKGNTTNSALKLLAWASLFTIAIFSIIPHKEWRFLHFLLPIFLQFGVKHLLTIPKTKRSKILRYLSIIPIVPAIYLGGFHGRAQVSVTGFLRTDLPQGQSVAVLMPCHSTPWQSHIHRRDLDGGQIWALTCEPPIG
jgi:GPI mannosyltransferase 3